MTVAAGAEPEFGTCTSCLQEHALFVLFQIDVLNKQVVSQLS